MKLEAVLVHFGPHLILCLLALFLWHLTTINKGPLQFSKLVCPLDGAFHKIRDRNKYSEADKSPAAEVEN